MAGRGPSPVVKRAPKAAVGEPVSEVTRKLGVSEGGASETPCFGVLSRSPQQARELIAARVVQETADAVTLVLRDRDGKTFAFRPGQFFTVLSEIDGEVVPRNYSASNAPGATELHLTIKKKVGGRVSGILSRSSAGERLRVLGPFGSFVVEPHPSACRRLVLVAGGAGITPLMSIARTVLAAEPGSEIALVYANVREEDAIFHAELAALRAAHASRLSVNHVLGPRLDRAIASLALDGLAMAGHPDALFYVCGPDGMRDEVLAALAARGVSEASIKIERFAIGPRPQVAMSSAAIAASIAPGARPIAIRVKGRTHRTVALPGATVLEAGLAAGAPMPFSCGVGGCGACRVLLVEGDVELEEPNCLSDAERAAGYVLTCVGRPCGACTVEVPEELPEELPEKKRQRWVLKQEVRDVRCENQKAHVAASAAHAEPDG